jgi:hypothetical protein
LLLGRLEVPERLVLELSRCLRAEGLYDTADTLEDACDRGHGIDREATLGALEYCPYGLSELRGVLLLGQKWRVAAGLVSHAPSVA